MEKYKLITFDMYSALLDISGSAVPLIREAADLPDGVCVELFSLWRSRQWTCMLLNGCTGKEFVSYSEITRQTLDQADELLGLELPDETKDALLHHVWENFKAWPEAAAVIAELKARGYQTAMLSNGDLDMLRPLENSTGITFDYIFSADMARAHKPCPAIYSLPEKILGLHRGEYLHVCGSANDLYGAVSAGIPVIWHNRKNDLSFGRCIRPLAEIKTLEELLTIL